MDKPVIQVEYESTTPIPPPLLIAMHDTAVALIAEDNILLHNWGLHLMEDWRSLELIAEQYR